MGFPTASPLHLHERCLALLCPLDQMWDTLSGEISQGAGQVGHESVVVTSQPQELPHLFWSLEAGRMRLLLSYSSVGAPAFLPSGTRDSVPSSCTLLRVGCEPLLPWGLQDHGHPLHMLHPGVTVDDDII